MLLKFGLNTLVLFWTVIIDARRKVVASGIAVGVEILTRTDRPKPLLTETDSNSKTSQATLSSPFNNISDTRLYKLTQALKQRLMNRLV